MKHLFYQILFIVALAVASLSAQTNLELTDREQTLIHHVKKSLENADSNLSKLNDDTLTIEGKSSVTVRHLLNNLCSLPHTRYLEIGCKKGDTFINALYGNQSTCSSAIGIEQWTLSGRFYLWLQYNCQRFLPKDSYQLIRGERLLVSPSIIKEKVNVYFYRGNDPAIAFEHYHEIFDNAFISIIDNWSCEQIRHRTLEALQMLQFEVLFETTLSPKNTWDKERYVAVIRKMKKPYLILENTHCSGFGASFSSVLGTLDMYEKDNYAGLKVNFNGGLFLDLEKGENWWEYFFEPINLGRETSPQYTFTSPDVSTLIGNGFWLPRNRAYELIKKYIPLKPEIKDEMESYVTKHFQDHYVIGVHHRGTDKIDEAPRVSFEKTFAMISHIIAKRSADERDLLRIYVATDDQNFLDQLLETFSPSIVLYNDFARSKNDLPLHYGNAFYPNNYLKGKEALLDCLLLSQCDILIRPATSSLSIMSGHFNPALPVIRLQGDP